MPFISFSTKIWMQLYCPHLYISLVGFPVFFLLTSVLQRVDLEVILILLVLQVLDGLICHLRKRKDEFCLIWVHQ